MRAFRDIPIKQKLMAIIMATTVIALVLSAIGIVLLDTVQFRSQLQRDLEGLAGIAADNSTAALAFDDPHTAAETLASLRIRPHMVSACIYRMDGALFAQYTRHGAVAGCPPPAARDQVRFGRAEVFVWRSIVLDNRRIGTLVLRYDLGELSERLSRYGVTVLIVLLFASLIALLLSARLRAVIAAPISQLANAAMSVAATEDYSIRAKKLSNDELGLLVDQFNDMLSRLQSRDADLRRARDELERRVKERTQQLTLQAAELTRSNAELQQFAYVASHDLQEPLRMVISYMQIISDQYRGKLDQDADEFIGYAVDGAQRMRQLINDLLAYSRVGAGRQELVPIDCGVILEQVRANLSVTIEENSAVITNDPLPKVISDPSQMLQLFQNLIANAIKFRGPEPPRIHVSAQADTGFWRFSVADNGIGIQPEHHQLIFVIFQRLHDRTEYPGTGIGLAICKKIIDHLGGRIWVESEPGQGSRFYFSLPINPSSKMTKEEQ